MKVRGRERDRSKEKENEEKREIGNRGIYQKEEEGGIKERREEQAMKI